MTFTQRRVTFTAALIFTVASAGALDLPPEFTAEYVIEKGFVELGRATRTFKKTPNGTYLYVSDSHATGIASLFVRERVVQTTEFSMEGGQARPLTYKYENNKGLRVNQTYDWKNKRVHSVRNDEVYDYDIPSNTHDQNIYQFNLMLDLATGKRDMVYPMAENKRLEQYDIRFLGEKVLDTHFGKQPVLVTRSQHKSETTTVWSAKSLYFLPVRIDREESSISFTARLVSLTGIPAQAK